MPSPRTLTVISLGGDVQAPTVSSIDSRCPSWYVLATTPIDSTVGSRPSFRAVSVFVWE